jgi:hypothetical protein
MFSLRSDMSGLGRICPTQGLNMSGPDEFTISKLDNMELREIMRTTRSKLKSRIQI